MDPRRAGGSGAGLIVVSPTGRVYEQALKFLFKASNNEADYEALLAGMDYGYTLGAEHLCAFSDSQLIVSQVMGEYEARDAVMAAYLSKVKERAKCFKKFEIKHVPRSKNRQADSLSKLASSSPDGHPKNIRWEILHQPSVAPEAVAWVDRSETWMDSLVSYLRDGTLPSDPKDANRIRKKAQWFTLYEGVLYKKAFAQPLLRCATPDEGRKILEEIHDGECGAHIGGRTLAAKALRTGYYWPTLRANAIEMVHKCHKCQRFAPVHHQPSAPLTAIHSPCLLYTSPSPRD